MHIITSDYYVGDDLTLICELEYEPASPGQPNPEYGDCCPPTPAQYWLIKASVECSDGCLIDVTPILSDELRNMIELTAGGNL